MKRIVADAGPLIVFAGIGRLDVLKAVVDEILVPPAVAAECVADAGKPGAEELRRAIDAGFFTPLGKIDLSAAPSELFLLDTGEKEAILAAKANRCAVLIDESLGRAAARKMGVLRVGSIGILLEAKRLGHIDKLKEIIDGWRAGGYFPSDRVIADALSRAGELDSPSGRRKR